ncbi:hypothetical protein D3C87_1700200 [compost metagenome]
MVRVTHTTLTPQEKVGTQLHRLMDLVLVTAGAIAKAFTWASPWGPSCILGVGAHVAGVRPM